MEQDYSYYLLKHSGLNSRIQPYVVQRLINQKARLRVESPESLPPTPPPEWEPDSDAYDTDLEEEKDEDHSPQKRQLTEQNKEDNGIGSLLYRKICSQISTPPQSSIVENLAHETVKIPQRQMGASNLTGLMCALLTNTRLTCLDLSNNHLGYEGGRELTTVLLANHFIADLNLSSNGFGGNGISAFLAKLLRNNRTIKALDVSSNGFTDEDAKYISAGIESNEYVEILNLSHNNFSEEGALYLGKAVAANDTLEDLDLSWNSIRRKGAVTICKPLKRNFMLRKINLAWNGLYYEGALAVRDALKYNKHLVEIDISNNRINWEGALFLAEMLQNNCYLEVLRAGHNPLTTTGCLDIIDAISRNENSGLQLLDLTEVPVIKNFVHMSKRIQQQREHQFSVIHGEVVPHHDVLGERSARAIHPMQKIINYMYEKEMRPLELLRSFDKDGKFVVSQDDFIQRLLAKGIDIKSWEKKQLMDYVLGNGYGEGKELVDYKKLIDSVTTQIDLERNIRIQAREKSRTLNEMHDRMLQSALPPLNVDAALVQVTGIKSATIDRDPHTAALRHLSDVILERSTNSFESKMAMAKNIKLVDINSHSTPLLHTLTAQPMEPGGESYSPIPSPRTSSKVIMSSPLSNVRPKFVKKKKLAK